MRERSARLRHVLVSAWMVAAMACTNDESSPERVSRRVGAAGAAISGPRGTGLTVAPGALEATVEITMTVLPSVRAPRQGAVVGTPVRLDPSGQRFGVPVEVRLPVDPARLPQGASIADVVVVRAEDERSTWVPLPTRRSGEAEVAALTEHFSLFVPIVPYAGDGGDGAFGSCNDGACGANETCESCPIDCGLCPSTPTDGGPPAPFCGNAVCDGQNGETCASCAYDCGECGTDGGTNPGVCGADNGGCDPAVSCRPGPSGAICGVCPIGTTNSNGACVACVPSGADVPDLTAAFVDSDCDGIDGDVATTLFVAPFGDDEFGTGTPTAPFATLGRAIAIAQISGIREVAVAEGVYAESVLMADGISVHGGYVASEGWWRSADATAHATVLRPTVPTESHSGPGFETFGVDFTGITLRTVLDRLTVDVGEDWVANPPASQPGVTHYAIRVVDNPMSTPAQGVEIHHVRGIAREGTPGRAGANGSNGLDGVMGGPGQNGMAAATVGALGGSGSEIQCAFGEPSYYTGGGMGGMGGYDSTDMECAPDVDTNRGQPGSAPNADLSCSGGLGGDGVASCTGSPTAGQTGAMCMQPNGATGAGGSALGHPGGIPSGYGTGWYAMDGYGGQVGSHGSGGSGGGGGGAGDGAGPAGFGGGGGGGGGSGGCGGEGGSGGQAGGSSFGLFVANTNGLVVVGSTFEARGGGAGGAGGTGGVGGAGGGGGPGGLGVGGSGNPSQGGGGPGAAGQSGFAGGGGGGGPGGVAIAQLVCNSIGVSGIDATTGTAGPAGLGGAGGLPGGRAAANGVSQSFYTGCGFGPVCGDGIVEPPEACDDGNTVDNDSCTNSCSYP